MKCDPTPNFCGTFVKEPTSIQNYYEYTVNFNEPFIQIEKF